MFTEDLLKHIVDESIKYAHNKNRMNFSLSVPMLKRFIGFLLFTGYSCLPQEKLHWSPAVDVSTPLVHNAMTCSSYMAIKQNIHLADNTTIDKTDKLAKVRLYIKILNKNFMKYGVFSTHRSIGEQMIPYFGKHSCKMFMQGKPVRFGFKVWCLCSSNGYLY
ncbi:Chimeric ERCC6-PGBD3 protein [Araneus ventricosus]|uniref:Chimeric ERCC6-PGBD3 protein n=1 Tax=Araneus ventricosus TaxID=182803 RepID=A0A4Y1ZWU7_ARAVE|nr:Chimeric ERCC6-PGBD3 protein [Araneus ventricosus]